MQLFQLLWWNHLTNRILITFLHFDQIKFKKRFFFYFFYKNWADIINNMFTCNSLSVVNDYNYFYYVTKLSDDITYKSLLPNTADCTDMESLQRVWFSTTYLLWGTMLWNKPCACKDFIVCREVWGESQFTNPFICSAQRMSVWFQLGAAICLLRNKLKWITRLMAFWLGSVQTGRSQCSFFIKRPLQGGRGRDTTSRPAT